MINEYPMPKLPAPEVLSQSLPYAASQGDHDKVLLLLDKGADVYEKLNGRTALHSAIEHSHLSVVELLLQRGVDPNKEDDGQISPLYRSVDSECDTALQLGAARPSTKVAELLIGYGADPNLCCSAKHLVDKTPVSLAAKYGSDEFLELFARSRPIS